MGVENLLATHKATILKKWFDQTVNTYPPDTARFLKHKKDPFDNPVGAATHKGLDAILDALVSSPETKVIAAHFDPIIRIRAVQNFTPSQAVSFVFSLKGIIRETLGPQAGADALAGLEERIDRLALIAFDAYMRCREKIYELRANEARNRFFKAFERAGLITELPEDKGGLD
jgi:hypothetical protein